MLVACALASCNAAPNIHDTQGPRGQPCATCHSAAFEAALTPRHVNVLPDTCGSCHNTTAWTPATAAVHPWFALDGAHLATSCAGCHSGNPPDYTVAPKECVGCHLAKYQGSPYPVHASFPQTCPDCHTTSGWKPATSGYHPEPTFPIMKGSHANAAITCTDCHISALGSPLKGANTDCIHCHLGAHNEPAIDSIHASVGPTYPGPNRSSPNFCLGCHPGG